MRLNLLATSAVRVMVVSALAVVMALGSTGRAVAQDVPFTGVVVQNQTDVRAGAADRYYRVGELNKGQLVQVDEVIAGWNKIVPPEGFYSYISKAFVDAKGDGSTGIVNTDRCKVYAADVNGPAGSYRVQTILNAGDGVQIVAEEGSHYKIVPPRGAYVYLPPGSVRRALAIETNPAEVEETPEPDQPEEPAAPAVQSEPKPEPPAPEPVVEPATPEPVQPAEVTEPAPAPVVVPAEPVVTEPAVAVESDAADTTEPANDSSSDQVLNELLGQPSDTTPPSAPAKVPSLAELEQRLAEVKDLPVEEKPLAELIAGYEALQQSGQLTQAQANKVRRRLAVLRYEHNIAEALRAIAEAKKAQPAPPAPVEEPETYNAVGRLLASSVFDGTTLPRMFRLSDPATGSAVAYVRPDGPVPTTPYLGKLVGVVGETRYDPDLKIRVIDVERIVPLQPAE